jgi:plastocyanin
MQTSVGKGAAVVALAGVLGLAVIGCSSSKASTTGAVNATESLAFTPATVTIRTGGVIKWTNTGQLPHTVTFDSGPFFDQQLPVGQTLSRTFGAAGTFTYHCSIHGPSMHGTVIVK